MKAAFCFGVDQASHMRVAAEPVSAAGEFANYAGDSARLKTRGLALPA
jgi:hypothetical protein